MKRGTTRSLQELHSGGRPIWVVDRFPQGTKTNHRLSRVTEAFRSFADLPVYRPRERAVDGMELKAISQFRDSLAAP